MRVNGLVPKHRSSPMPFHEPLEVQGRVDFSQDHFTLFGLPARFTLDTDALTRTWRQLQAAVHPDRFVNASPADKRLAMQWSTQVNTAYRTLKDAQQRAAYLCELRGVAIDAERNTAMPTEFLTQQLQWRERLDEVREAGDASALQAMVDEVERARDQALLRLVTLLDQAPRASPEVPELPSQSTQDAAALVRVLMFIDKFRQDLASLLPHPGSNLSTPAA